MIHQIFFSEPGKVEVRKAPPPPAPGNDEVLLQTAFVGICGTDAHVLHGKHRIKPRPVIGQEMAGVVEAIGANVSHLSPGDRVALNPVVPFGHCETCRRGRYNIFEKATIVGFVLPGAAQTKLVVNQRQLRKEPDLLPSYHAALAEALSVVDHTSSRGQRLDEVLIIGAGTIGLCELAAASSFDAEAVITDVKPLAEAAQAHAMPP